LAYVLLPSPGGSCHHGIRDYSDTTVDQTALIAAVLGFFAVALDAVVVKVALPVGSGVANKPGGHSPGTRREANPDAQRPGTEE
jgi:hypothetical protein